MRRRRSQGLLHSPPRPEVAVGGDFAARDVDGREAGWVYQRDKRVGNYPSVFKFGSLTRELPWLA